MPVDRGLRQPWNTALFSATAIWWAAPSSGSRSASSAPRSASRSSRSETLEVGAQLDQRQHPPLPTGSTPSHGAVASVDVRPRFVAECSQPWGPEKSTSLRAASAGVSRSRASSSSSSQPESVIGASERSRWFIAALP